MINHLKLFFDLPAVINHECLFCPMNMKTTISRANSTKFEYICKTCHERYYVWSDGYFGLSINDIWVYFNKKDIIHLCNFKPPSTWQNWREIPYFVPNFSNKDDLYHELKTYQLFI